MKKFFALWLLLPVWAISQQSSNVLSIGRLTPKFDKIAEFEKALSNHNQKFHTGEWKSMVFLVASGPYTGSYAITLGPLTWEQFDGRKPTTEHDQDWLKVLAMVQKAGEQEFLVFQDELSTVKPGDFVEKVSVNQVYYKPGYLDKIRLAIGKLKKGWESGNESVAVYLSNFSGAPHFTIATRHKEGWKEKMPGFLKPMPERMGDNEFDDFLELIREYTDKSWGELLIMRKDLSSK